MEIAEVKLKERGQITIPSTVRSLMGLKEGEELLLFATKNEIIIRSKCPNPLEMAGMLGREEEFTNIEDLIARYRLGGA
ncbi:MAG: AbrB/MazE/SpoVT family DNA-binding domain-containing protein [Candidatus Hydrothermarchaeales archaeon]